MIDFVFHARLALPQAFKFTLGVVVVQNPDFRSDLRGGDDHQVFLGARGSNADVVALVFFLKHQHVFRLRGADAVAPDGIGAPGFIDALVEDVFLSYPAGAVKDSGEFVGKIFAGLQVFDIKVKALVAGGVHRIRQIAPAGSHRRSAEGEKLVTFGQRVEV